MSVGSSSRRSVHLPNTDELKSQLRSPLKIKSGDSLCDDPFSEISEVAALLFS